MPPRPKDDAYATIFAGDDSDLSDLDEGDLAPPPAGGASSDGEMDEEGDEDAAETAAIEAEAEAEALRQEQARERMEEENDADYAGAAGPSASARDGALPSFRKEGGGAPKKKRPAGDGGERPKKRVKQKTTQQAGEYDEDDQAPPMPLDPVQERAARLDAILSQKKKKSIRKRKGEDDLDEMADEEVYRLRQLMDVAVETDKEAVQDGRPAIEKLKLLPDVVAVLQKPHLQDTILEADVLTQIRRWLEPIGKAMPALNIQRALLEALAKFEIETSQLKASEIGKIVLFYTKHPKLDSSITRMADQLVMNWMRPLIRRSAAMRDRQIERAEHDPRQRAPRPSKSASRQGGTGPGGIPPPATREDISKRHAAIPEAINTAYTIAPISRIAADPNNMPKKSERMKGMKAKLDGARQDARRM